ncbi:UDP-N-acetylmuramoyl-tripeptide--D-alanyl-D-alanine ligase [Pararhodospirillum oryzae]|uniref:UDP-N-acetylmuramoyl-tripeptide--D-alanyl-D-alanine ligase n=1 Tax=Pararhodospirillum oryzae TaxID=478448 RepID=A0A512H8T5_9PROT|nr:UDP-N-acetylmuramoyl-tripeptide--D-alanyl-D-alanine ligase [Pararhodospirillum oryzae]GEO81820.1 UDP-N-acetylmuramoyl-tripeptide--D-alanyl-D-alanine ligase [Pararhodospirillum oryzae]
MTRTAPVWTASQAAQALGVPPVGAWQASGVSIDTRTLAPGDLFVALPGARSDGHDHVAAALAQGAAAALVSRVPDGVDRKHLLVVPDVQAGLEALARAARARFRGKVVGVTGSVGKTGSKDMLALALAELGRVHATRGNLNNHLGVPLTLAALPAEADLAVIEMGMNHAGELGPLSALARPHVVLITAIAPAHLEFFDSVEAIADAKAEILDGLEPGGAAVFNRDSRHFERLCRHARRRGVTRILGFGRHIGATARLLDDAVDAEGTAVLALVGDEALSYRVGVAGRQWAQNSLGVLGVVLALGLDVARAARGLALMQAPVGRGRHTVVPLPQGGTFVVIDESYNASPDSLVAALTTLSLLRPGPGGRRIAVLGDMLELGAQGPALHAGLARTVLDRGLDLVYTAGPLMAHLHAALPVRQRGDHAPDAETLAPVVRNAVRPGDVVMVKGSHGCQVGRVVAALLAMTPRPGERAIPPAGP